MAKPFLTDEAKRALTDAVRDVEAVTSAELVVAVRARSGSYLHADLTAGILAGLVTLGVLLFSHWEFGLVWFVIDPLLVGLLFGWISSWAPGLRRALTSPADRRQHVESAARALFVEKRVHNTRGRTGMLLYISLLEREAVIVPDVGLEALVATGPWKAAVAAVETAVHGKEDGVQVARKICDLGPVLAPVLPRAADDVDELANEVCE
jgi:putative membrane protein